jgi:hypothetical protein
LTLAEVTVFFLLLKKMTQKDLEFCNRRLQDFLWSSYYTVSVQYSDKHCYFVLGLCLMLGTTNLSFTTMLSILESIFCTRQCLLCFFLLLKQIKCIVIIPLHLP